MIIAKTRMVKMEIRILNAKFEVEKDSISLPNLNIKISENG